MATNWTMVDAFEVIKKNEDRAAVADIVKRFPLTSRAMILASTNEGAEEIVRGLPVYVTVRKIENVLKGEIEDDEVEATEPAKKGKKKPEPEDEDVEDEDDEDEEEEASKKKHAKKGKKTSAKKSKKKPEPEEEDVDDDDDDDDDDDWDI